MKKYLYTIVLAAAMAVLPTIANAADYLTVAEAMDVYSSLNLADGSSSSSTYTIRGYVTRWKSGYPDYQNAEFYIDDTANGSTTMLLAFRAKGNSDSDKRKLNVGEYVELTGKFQNYQGKAEIVNGTYSVLAEETPPDPVNYYTVAEIKNVYDNMGLASGATSSESFIVRGYVTQWKSGYPNYQNADFYFDDSADGSGIECFRLTASVEEDKRVLNVGEYVEATAQLKNYNGRCELVNGTFVVIEGETPPSPKTYTLTISAGVGGTVNSEVNGTYEENTKVTIKATANEGYTFAQWSDGNTSATRTITMNKNYTLQAQFEKEEPECLHPELEGKKGLEIRDALYEQIKDHTVLTYSQVRGDNANVDFKTDGRLWDIYNNCSSLYKANYCRNEGSDVDECDCYNREHVLPKSFWGSSTDEPMYTDLHHVYSTDAKSNSMRSAWPYGAVYSATWTNNAGAKVGNSYTYGNSSPVFEPVDEFKGDIARIYFYMATCYKNKNFTQGGKGFEMFTWSNGECGFTEKALKILLKWHRNDAVSQKEVTRNGKVEGKQGNRNPFVDDPDLVEYIWGDKANVAFTCNPETGIKDAQTETHANVQKVVSEGHLYIVRDGEMYSITGVKVK